MIFYKIHYMVLDISSGVFASREQALLYLDALRKKVEDICRKKNCSCLFYGAVSISEAGNVKRTARRSKLINDTLQVPPHIHCILLLEKQSAVLRKLQKYLKQTKAIKKYRELNHGKKGFYSDAIRKREDLSTRLVYRVSQGMNCRIVDTCTEEFATKYAGDFVSLIEAQEKAMGGSKLVFPQYANMELGTDESVFDFSINSKNTEKTNNEVWKSDSLYSETAGEVWKFDIENSNLVSALENDKIVPILPQKTSIFPYFIDNFGSDISSKIHQKIEDKVYNEINILNNNLSYIIPTTNNFSYTHT